MTLTDFVPLVLLYMKQPLKLDDLGAALCLVAAVFFMCRGGLREALAG